jgi:hypothetical protein
MFVCLKAKNKTLFKWDWTTSETVLQFKRFLHRRSHGTSSRVNHSTEADEYSFEFVRQPRIFIESIVNASLLLAIESIMA